MYQALPESPYTLADDFAGEHIEHTPTITDLVNFWEALRPWLASQGVFLYETCSSSRSWELVWRTPSISAVAPLPFARCIKAAPQPYDIGGRLAYGQDSSGKDVTLKLVGKDSRQHRIFEFLLQNAPVFSDASTFPCVLPPLGLLDTHNSYCIAYMPTWANDIHLANISTLEEVLRFMDCLLKGLNYLHTNRIAHRDIWHANIVVNCYRQDQDRVALADDLRHHRTGNHVFYALMDYDQSIKLPSEISLRTCRRPADEACFGADLYKPGDTGLGEPEYNPFAYDVAMLGNLFRVHFCEAASTVPALAALFDKMTTYYVSQRFTAEEAWQFFQDQTGHLGNAALATPLSTKPVWQAQSPDHTDAYWSRLSAEEYAIWGQFRSPPIPSWVRILARIVEYPIGWKIVSTVRRAIRV